MECFNCYDKLRNSTLLLLNCGEENGLMKKAVDQMLQVYLTLLNPKDELMELKFYTSIKIFKNEFLTEGDSGLNTPLKLMELNMGRSAELECNYMQTYPPSIITSMNYKLTNTY